MDELNHTTNEQDNETDELDYGDLLVAAVLLVSSIYLISITIEFDSDGRAFPLFVLVVIAVLALVKLCISILDFLNVDIPFGGRSDETGGIYGQVDSAERSSDGNLFVREIGSIAWATLFVGAFYVFGIMPSIPLLLFSYIHVNHDTSLKHNIVITGSVSTFLYVVFVVFLEARLYEGLLLEYLPTLS